MHQPGFQKSVTIIQGQSVSVQVQLLDANLCPVGPFNLSGLTGCTGFFPAADEPGDSIAVTGILQSADLGVVTFGMDEETTPLLNVGEQQGIEVWVDQGSQRSICQLQNILNVNASLFTSGSFPGT